MALEALDSPRAAGRSTSGKDRQLRELSAKGKRSKRRRSEDTSSDDIPASLSEENFYALCLIMLARGDGRATSERLADPPAPMLSYKCSLCDKSFASYQALGGHKSSHGKPSSSSAPHAEASAATPSSSSGGSRVHECSICHKTFATGQALGGHKRCHYVGGSGNSCSASTSSGAVGGSAPSRISHLHMDFDLNMPPRVESSALEVVPMISPPRSQGSKSQRAAQKEELECPLSTKKRRLFLTGHGMCSPPPQD
ncbi:hypothetical protein SAY87_024750 [Trapa incisa]|uniref:C2H2-type domain-containing protein n=1 Tax=Trapa incisa TaxID=236973 RepID=A0AAN7GR97_9MYRT|nr:hypothetical protein SAY87_024750 [Trapa incisa]